MLKKLSKNAKLTISILLIFIGLFLTSYNYFDSIKKNLFNEKNIELLEQQVVINEEIEEINEEPTEVIDTEVDVPKISTGINDYIGILRIPDLNLERGFLSLDSEYNSINYNVQLIEGSTMPNVEKGNLILAAHRGNSSVSFFDKLYTLNMGANAYVEYKNKTYKYELINVYTEAKDGVLTIKRSASETTLTLITCTRDDKTTQSIFIFKLVSVE